MTATRWSPPLFTREERARAALRVIGRHEVRPIVPGFDLWDMWPIARTDGATVIVGGRSWWFFLATPRLADPDWRHDAARIRLTSQGADGWRDEGDALPEGFSPGDREWSGSAVLADDGETLRLFFTATGRRGTPRTFEQRLFETRGRFAGGTVGGWSTPVESIAADGNWYARADQAEPVDGAIKGFRDPGYCRDPADGAEHLLFTGSAGGSSLDGLIGIATRDGGCWRLRPPLVDATGVNAELERPHIVVHAGRYHLFWSTQGKRFAPGLDAPTGLYGMVADTMAGPWRPLNGSGLVAANPAEEPHQAYCWWVTGELDVISFVDLAGLAGASPADAAVRRRHFGGTAAPWFRLRLDGDTAAIA